MLCTSGFVLHHNQCEEIKNNEYYIKVPSVSFSLSRFTSMFKGEKYPFLTHVQIVRGSKSIWTLG